MLSKLFDLQRKLDQRIIDDKKLHDEDLLPKKILALQVELGELANEWRGFKFWSENQFPNDRVFKTIDTDMKVLTNPLLEEYVDCLHFILSIGLEFEKDGEHFVKRLNVHKDEIINERKPSPREMDLIEQFSLVYFNISEYEYSRACDDYYDLAAQFILLGAKLGFGDKQVEQAYIEKNKENHNRQGRGY